MNLHPRGIVAVVLGFVLSIGLHFVPVEELACPDGTCPFTAPSGVRGVVSTSTRLQIAWEDVPKAFAYRVQVAPRNNFVGADVLSLTKQEPTSPTPLVIPNLAPGTTYHVRVSVIDRALNQQSEWSTPATYLTKGGMRLSVGTYNIRNPDDTWDERGPAVADGIVGEKLHVLGVQEVYQPWERRSLLEHVNLKATASMGSPVYGMAPGPYSEAGYDNRILYDTRILELKNAGGERYDYQVGQSEVDRWFAWATFKHRSSGWNMLFVTTHLAPANDYADLRQWTELVQRVNELKAEHRTPWVVVAGDFNTTKQEKPADVMLARMRANGYGDVLGQKYRSYGVYGARAQVKKDAYLRSFNGFRRNIDKYSVDEDRNGNGVDWIFASNELAVPYYRVVANYDDDGKLIKPIPSDHFLVRATLAYEPPQPNRSTVAVAKDVTPVSSD